MEARKTASFALSLGCAARSAGCWRRGDSEAGNVTGTQGQGLQDHLVHRGVPEQRPPPRDHIQDAETSALVRCLGMPKNAGTAARLMRGLWVRVPRGRPELPSQKHIESCIRSRRRTRHVRSTAPTVRLKGRGRTSADGHGCENAEVSVSFSGPVSAAVRTQLAARAALVAAGARPLGWKIAASIPGVPADEGADGLIFGYLTSATMIPGGHSLARSHRGSVRHGTTIGGCSS